MEGGKVMSLAKVECSRNGTTQMNWRTILNLQMESEMSEQAMWDWNGFD